MFINGCYAMLIGGTHYTFMSLLGEKENKIIISSSLSVLFTFILSLIISKEFSFLIGHIIFIGINLLFKRSLYVSFMSVLLSISLEFVICPLYYLVNVLSFEWEYIFYIIACIDLFAIYTISNSKKIEKDWLYQEICFDRKKRIYLLCSAILGMLLNMGIASTLVHSLLSSILCILLITLNSCLLCVILSLVVYIHRFKQLEINMNKWQKESRDYINVIRSQRHDFNFHVHAIVGLIENNEYEECRKYVTEVANEASSINDIMPVHDAVVGSMLYNMREAARSKGSDIRYEITYDMEHVVCNSFEINKILGNLIQNALDAMNFKEEIEAGIDVKIFKRRGNTVIIVSNLFSGDKSSILRAFDLGFSTKSKHEGIGLSMISKSVEKYGGRIYTEFNNDWISFIVNIPNYVHFEEVES